MSDQTIGQSVLRTQADYEREIDRLFSEIDRLDERIVRHQEETRRSRERTQAMLAEMRRE